MYSIDKAKINAFQGEIRPSNWPKLSENCCARTSAHLAAAQRIIERRVVGRRNFEVARKAPRDVPCFSGYLVSLAETTGPNESQ